VLPDRTEARQERLCTIGQSETAHAALAFTRGLMTVLGTVVNACSRFDEDVLHVRQFRDFSFRRAVTAQLIGDDRYRRVAKEPRVLLKMSKAGHCLRTKRLQPFRERSESPALSGLSPVVNLPTKNS
jgi:hypothetical protein